MIRFQTEGETPLPTLTTPMSSIEQSLVINRLILIHQLSLILQTQLDQERLLRIMLSGITAGEALGFNRALVFLLDADPQELYGALGVGPINEEECRHVWQTLADSGHTLQDFITEFGHLTRYQTAQLNVETQSIRWKMGRPNDLFTRTLEEKVCYHITEETELLTLPPPVANLLDVNELVVVPLVVTGKPLGLVVADNKFSNRPISEQDILLLSIVANQTAAALSHISLIRELERFQNHLEEKVREAVAEKEKAQEDMIRRAKLATVGEMAVTVAHEIRNPLTAVRGFAQRLHRKYEDPVTVHAYSEIIISEVDRLNHVLGDVLDFARNVDAKRHPVNLNDVVHKSVHLMEEKLGQRQIVLEVDLDPDMPTCYYDATQLSQVLINLIKNAEQAMKEGGVIELNTHCDGKSCILTVTDTGTGIDPKDLKRVFEPFYTTKVRGTGLGLPLAKRIIEEHGGDITVCSQIGEGTIFRIVLPIQEVPPKIRDVIESLDHAKPVVDLSDPLTSYRSMKLDATEQIL